jgi:C4-dicarboxylate-binding protein DctP
MRIGMVTINDTQHQLANRFKEEIEKRLKGAIKVSVFPAAQLGKIPRQIENLKLGAQQAFVSPPGFFAGINKSFQVPDAPGVFKNFWHAHNTLTHPDFRGKFLRLAENAGIVGITVANYGPISIASLKPIRNLDDMKGIKVRVLATPMESKAASVMGMTGVPMPYSEVLPALQQRTIDACSSNAVVMGASKFHTATKFITMTETGHIPSAMWVSKRWLDKLPKAHQEEILKLGRELETWVAKTAFQNNKNAEKVWKDNGTEVIRLSAADQATMVKRLAPLGDEFLAKDPKTKDMYALMKATLAKASDKAPN